MASLRAAEGLRLEPKISEQEPLEELQPARPSNYRGRDFHFLCWTRSTEGVELLNGTAHT
jgi:hypothetical protein